MPQKVAFLHQKKKKKTSYILSLCLEASYAPQEIHCCYWEKWDSDVNLVFTWLQVDLRTISVPSSSGVLSTGSSFTLVLSLWTDREGSFIKLWLVLYEKWEFSSSRCIAQFCFPICNLVSSLWYTLNISPPLNRNLFNFDMNEIMSSLCSPGISCESKSLLRPCFWLTTKIKHERL